MRVQQLMVYQFMHFFHKRYFDDSDIDFKEELKLCKRLISEESKETLEKFEEFITNCKNDEKDIETVCNLTKEMCDLIYVILFTANFLGLPLTECFQEVHIHNMGKTDGHEGPGGKWIKPEGYPPCNLKKVLERMGYIS